MPSENMIELSLYVDKSVRKAIEARAKAERRSTSWIGNELLKTALDKHDELDSGVRRNLEARATDLNMTQGQMMNTLLRSALGMDPSQQDN